MAINPLDLVFRPDSRAPLELVFGDEAGTGSAPEYSLAGGGQVTGLRRAEAGLVYDINVSRPLLALRSSRFQEGQPVSQVQRSTWQDADHLARATRIVNEPSRAVSRVQRSRWQDAHALAIATRISDQQGSPLATALRGRFEQAQALAAATRSRFERGTPVVVSVNARFQEVIRLAPVIRSRFEPGRHLVSLAHDDMQPGLPMLATWRLRFQQGRYPPPGASPKPPGPDGRDDWCYVPTDPIELLFRPDDRAPLELVFECERHGGGEPEPGATIVVPLRGLYMIHNTITLNRASDGLPLPVTGVELSIDDSSFTWGWSATAGGTAEVAALMAALDPDSGEPVEVELGINGVAYRLLTDPVDRQRQFPRSALRIPGRGLAAELDAPVARQMVFSQAAARTAQQLANEALQVNGVGIGWDVDWQLTDWLVPGGVWSHQGTHISAVAAIAGAAGGYIQPHRTARTLRVLPRYPAPPWDWPDLSPDYELPIGPVTVEGIQWQRLPDYNRVYVFGEAEPVRGRVTRAGTDGAIEAPMVTNPLITAAEAVLQAGTAVLGNTGKQALVTLTLPVLAETGVILPGALVRYVDGSKARLGLVRSTSVSWQRPKLRQSIKVETHILEGA